jgi:hypothetical protein
MSRRNVHQETSALLLHNNVNNNDPKAQTLSIDDFTNNNDNSDNSAVLGMEILSPVEDAIVTSPERKKYHSICNVDDIPTIARDVTWNDPFYQNDKNVIAAFDIDQNQVEQYLENTKKYYYMILITFIGVMFYSVLIAIFICIFWLGHVNVRRSKCSRYRTVHIAITQNGIYVDECDRSSYPYQKLMQRTIIKYETIHKCYIQTYSFWFHPYYEIIFENTKNEMMNTILGFFEVQKFVDIMNVMIESSNRASMFTDNDDRYNTNAGDNYTETREGYNAENLTQIQQQSLTVPHEPEIQAVIFDE